MARYEKSNVIKFFRILLGILHHFCAVHRKYMKNDGLFYVDGCSLLHFFFGVSLSRGVRIFGEQNFGFMREDKWERWAVQANSSRICSVKWMVGQCVASTEVTVGHSFAVFFIRWFERKPCGALCCFSELYDNFDNLKGCWV